MIRVKKNHDVPSSLTTTSRYDGEDVRKQLLVDQNDKCYLCERKRDTDFEIEHHKSTHNFPDLVQDWNNLYMGCGYCNRKKSDSFDNTLVPKDCNIEDEIEEGVWDEEDYENFLDWFAVWPMEENYKNTSYSRVTPIIDARLSAGSSMPMPNTTISSSSTTATKAPSPTGM